MNLRDLAGLLLACAAGFLGGSFAAGHRVAASAPNIVRATAFELVDASGAPVARWRVGVDNTVRMSFLFDHENEALQIGVANGRPFVRMAGRDGRDRMVMELDAADKPMIGMGDEKWEGRVHLGFLPPDTFPYGDWDNWGLSFRGVGSQRAVAAIGMLRKGTNRFEGFIALSGKRVR